MSAQLALLPELLTAHLQLTLAALWVGFVVSVPLGVVATRLRRLEAPVTMIASVVQTIPGLALLAVMVPALAALGLTSIGFPPAFLGLVLYSVLPMLRNTITGLRGIAPAMIEAARGVGMRPAQRLWRVELPLALPVIVAGVRTSTVWTVGMATLSTPVGAPSLGNYIFSGLQMRNFTAVLVGCVAASLLALFLDALVHLAERGLVQRRRAFVATALAIAAGLYAIAGYAAATNLVDVGARPLRIGAKSFTEQYVLAGILAGRIESAAGRSSVLLPSLGSTVAFDALRDGEIDVYADYSGTIWATIMKRDGIPSDRRAVLRDVRRFLADEHGIEVVAALGFENTYALAMRRGQAETLGVASISDLAGISPRLQVGGDYEFFSRAEWRSLEDVYGLRFREKRAMDPSLMYQAVSRGNVDVIGAYSTDGRIAAFDLVVLEDDRGAIPPYDAVVLAAPGLETRAPLAVAALRTLEATIDAEAMRAMNFEVDRGGADPAAVARAFLDSMFSTRDSE